MSTKTKTTSKQRIVRDESIFGLVEAALEKLKTERAKIEITDKRIVEEKWSEILELRESGISYKDIHAYLRETIGLRIKYETFFGYIRQTIAQKSTLRPEYIDKHAAKTTKVSVPASRKAEFKRLAKMLVKGKSGVVIIHDNRGRETGRIIIKGLTTKRQRPVAKQQNAPAAQAESQYIEL